MASSVQCKGPGPDDDIPVAVADATAPSPSPSVPLTPTCCSRSELPPPVELDTEFVSDASGSLRERVRAGLQHGCIPMGVDIGGTLVKIVALLDQGTWYWW